MLYPEGGEPRNKRESDPSDEMWRVFGDQFSPAPSDITNILEYSINVREGSKSLRTDLSLRGDRDRVKPLQSIDRQIFDCMERRMREIVLGILNDSSEGWRSPIVRARVVREGLDEIPTYAMYVQFPSSTQGDYIFDLSDRRVFENSGASVMKLVGDSKGDIKGFETLYSEKALDQELIRIVNAKGQFGGPDCSPLWTEIANNISRDYTIPRESLPERIDIFRGGTGTRVLRMTIDGSELLVPIIRSQTGKVFLPVRLFDYKTDAPLYEKMTIVPDLDGQSCLAPEPFVSEDISRQFLGAAHFLGAGHFRQLDSTSKKRDCLVRGWIKAIGAFSGRLESDQETREFCPVQISQIAFERQGRNGFTEQMTLVMAQNCEGKSLLIDQGVTSAYEFGEVGMVLKGSGGALRDIYPVYSPRAFQEEIGRCMSLEKGDFARLFEQSFILQRIWGNVFGETLSIEEFQGVDVRLTGDSAIFHFELANETFSCCVKRQADTGLIKVQFEERNW